MNIENTSAEKIIRQTEAHRRYFGSGVTKPAAFRKEQLKKLAEALVRYEKQIEEALWEDLHKSPEETYLTEISIVKQELAYHRKKLSRWMRPHRVPMPVHLLPSSGFIHYEPLGVSLIIAPWNYPFQLLMNPLIGAISSGCCALLKPSPHAPAIARVMEEIVTEIFDPAYVSVAQGNRHVNTLLLEQRFDVIFFTGSPDVGKVVMKAASAHLTPVVLELGGKSPCIVDKDANIQVAARRIAWGKTINAGQTCIAPDYLFVHEAVKDELLRAIGESIRKMYGDRVEESRFYPRIVNEQAMQRLKKLMQHGRVVWGGNMIEEEKYIEPTLIDQVSESDPIMQEEIFGPLLPVFTFSEVREAQEYVQRHEKPLAYYYFGQSAKAKQMLADSTSGGACLNDVVMHIANHHLPFGGVGYSGVGKYHGEESFRAFSNARSVMKTPTFMDLPFRYPPFRFYNLVKKII